MWKLKCDILLQYLYYIIINDNWTRAHIYISKEYYKTTREIIYNKVTQCSNAAADIKALWRLVSWTLVEIFEIQLPKKAYGKLSTLYICYKEYILHSASLMLISRQINGPMFYI